MATPPETPKPRKRAKAATPAPRRSARKASTPVASPTKVVDPKPIETKADAAASSATAAPAPKAAKSARPVPKRSSPRRTAAVASATKAKPGPKPKAKPAASQPKPKSTAAAIGDAASTARRTLSSALPPANARTAWSLGAIALAAGAGIAAFLTRGRIRTLLGASAEEGHVPTDLLDPNRNADDRAVADFRPDMSAAMTAAEREALRPPVGLPN